MFTNEQYLLGWGCYIVAAVLLLLLVWFVVRRFWQYPKHIILLSTACILFTPFYIDADATHLAPAWLMASAETAIHFAKTELFDLDVFLRAGKLLLIVWFSVLAAYLACMMGGMLFMRHLSARTSQKQQAEKNASNGRLAPSLAAASQSSWHEPTASLSLIDEPVEPAIKPIDNIEMSLEDLTLPLGRPTAESGGVSDNSTSPKTGSTDSEPVISALPDDEYNDRLESSLNLHTGLEFDIDQELDKLTNPNQPMKNTTAIEHQTLRDFKD